MDHLSSKAIETIEERDVPGQLLMDMGITAIESAMSKPTIESPKRQPTKPTKASKSYSRPTVYGVDEWGEMQVTDRELGGYVDMEDYGLLLTAYEELLSRLDEVKELLS